MHYIVGGGDAGCSPLAGLPGIDVLADGEVLVMEGPWPLTSTVLACTEDMDVLPAGTAGAGFHGYAVEGFETPGAGGAFVIAAHKMLDVEGFRPYADAIPDLLQQFGVRSLARAGKVTPISGNFVPERAVVLEFASVEAALDFYTCETYAPLLALRLRTTDPRFVIMARSGAIPAALRKSAETYLAAHPRRKPQAAAPR